MSLNYKNVSSGYIGEHHEHSSLNSAFYYHYFDELNNSSIDLSNIIIFPQRIPRSGFFEELRTLETTYFKNRLDKITDFVEQNYDRSLHKLNQEPSRSAVRIFLNSAYLLSRYGRFEKIQRNFPIEYTGSHILEVDLLKELNNINISLSNDEVISIDKLLDLSKVFIHDIDTTDREKIILLNQTIVNFYRHQKKSSYQNEIFLLANEFLKLIQNFKTNLFMPMLYTSIAYRGLAMVHEFGQGKQNELLKEAEQFARDINGSTPLEKIVASDNLYTCLQTLSKWNFSINKFQKSEECLLEMISIDQNDSSAYSELGFFYAKRESYNNAAEQFKKALELGPPGTGMNAYYYAKCLEKIGQEKNAVIYLYQSADLDKQAVSPLLDLLNYYKSKCLYHKAREIANHISKTEILMEQLEEDEVILIQDFLK